MNAKVNRTLILLAVSAALFTISEVYNTPWMQWVRGASAGMALAGIIGVVLIIGESLRERK
jgi:high-affinity Fe2+/Pb2+ permease